MQFVDRSNIVSNLSYVEAKTYEAFIDLHAFQKTFWIDSNLAQTLRTCQINEHNLANRELTIFVLFLDVDREN